MSATSRRQLPLASRTLDPVEFRGNLDGLFRREAALLTRYFRRRTGNAEDAMDMMQEAFTRMAGTRRETPIEHPERYLQRIARNLLFDRAKSARIASSVAGIGEVAIRAEQEDGIRFRDVARQYEAALDALTPRTREVFVLHRIGQRTYLQIAAELGISVSTVEYHIARAIVAIGKALDRE